MNPMNGGALASDVKLEITVLETDPATQNTFLPGETVRVQVRMINRSTQAMTRPDSLFVWYLDIYDSSTNRLVHAEHRGGALSGTVTLLPGEARDLGIHAWDQRDTHGAQVSPGSYWVHASTYFGVIQEMILINSAG